MTSIDRNAKSSDVAKALGLSTASVQSYARQGRIPCRLTPGGHYRFNVSEVVSLLHPGPLTFSDELVEIGFGSAVIVDDLSGYRDDPITPAVESRLRIRGHRGGHWEPSSGFDEGQGAAELDSYIRQSGGAAVAVLHR